MISIQTVDTSFTITEERLKQHVVNLYGDQIDTTSQSRNTKFKKN